VTVKPSYGLSDDDISRMLNDGMREADQDARLRMLREQQVDTLQLIESVQAALSTDADLLTAVEQTRIEQLIDSARAAAHGDDIDQVSAAFKALSAGTDDFAARRMDRSIRAALTGKTLDDLV